MRKNVINSIEIKIAIWLTDEVGQSAREIDGRCIAFRAFLDLNFTEVVAL